MINAPLLNQLSKIVAGYNPGLSALSKKCGLAYNTLKKIKNKEHRRLVKPKTVLSIGRTVSNKRKKMEIAEHFGGPIKEFIINTYSIQKNNDCDSSDMINEIAKNDFISFSIIKLCSSGKPVTEKEIISYLGYAIAKNSGYDDEDINDNVILHLGLPVKRKIEKLKDVEVIISNQQGHLITTGDFKWFESDVARNHVKSLISLSKPELAHRFLSQYQDVFGFVKLSTAVKINDKLFETVRDCVRLMDKDNETENNDHEIKIPFNIITFLDSYLSVEESNKLLNNKMDK
jgi:hypothetical protein